MTKAKLIWMLSNPDIPDDTEVFMSEPYGDAEVPIVDLFIGPKKDRGGNSILKVVVSDEPVKYD